MKVFQLVQKPQLRGAEIFASQLSRGLNELGHDSRLVVVFSGDKKSDAFEGEAIFLNRPPSKRFRDFAGWRILSELIRKEQPDLVQANAADTLKFAVFSKLLFRWKCPIVFRNANKMSDFIDSDLKKSFNQFLVSKCKGVASVSELCRLDFLDTFKFRSEYTKTLPIGVEEDSTSYTWPQDLALHENSFPRLVNVGSLVPEKNHAGLIRIFTEIHKDFPEAKLFVMGDGALRQELEEIIRKGGLEKNVFLLGYRKDVLNIVQSSDLFLMPSFIEGLPGVILESFMMKTPVIANDVGGISEVVKDDQTGRLIQVGDEVQFVEAVRELLNKSDKSSALAENAHDFVRENYLNQMIVRRFETFYQHIQGQN